MRLHLLSCAVGLFAGLSSAFAQPAQPMPMTTPLVPAPTTTAPAPVAGVVTGNCVVAHGPGCKACHDSTKFKLKQMFCIGSGCANNVACGNIFTERTFLFGSCRQFFNPGSECGPCAWKLGNCSGAGCHACGGCNHQEKHPCSGVTSHLNR